MKRWPRKAMALLVVLVLVMMASFIAYGYLFSMENQYRDARMYEEQLQAQNAALSGLELLTAALELSPEQRTQLGGLSDNHELFRDRVIEANLGSTLQSKSPEGWRFSIISPVLSNSQSPIGQPLAMNSPQSKSAVLMGSLGDNSTGDSLWGDDSLSSVKFGLENETAKISLPALAQWDRAFPGHARQVLMNLPGATPEAVESLLKRIGIQGPTNGTHSMQSDSTANQGSDSGASDAELRLHLLWMGGDLNCNYRVDPLDQAWSQSEETGSARTLDVADLYRGAARSAASNIKSGGNSSASSYSQDASPQVKAGVAWRQILSWHSGYRNQNQQGKPRINLNDPNLQKLQQDLLQRWPADWANYVILYRQYGAVNTVSTTSAAKPNSPTNSNSQSAAAKELPKAATPTTNSATDADASSLPNLNFSVPGTRTILSPLELIGAVTEVPASPATGNSGAGSTNNTKRRIKSPFQPDNLLSANYLGRLLDEATTQAGEFVSDRLDIREATLPVLMAVPNMDRATAEAIVLRRQRPSSQRNESTDQSTIAWLLESGVADLGRLVQLEPYLCNQSDVYACQVVGYRDDRSAVYRCTVTIDARMRNARVREFQTWHSWDKGFSVQNFSSSRATNRANR